MKILNSLIWLAVIATSCASTVALAGLQCAYVVNDQLNKPVKCSTSGLPSSNEDVTFTVFHLGKKKYVYKEVSHIDKKGGFAIFDSRTLQGLDAAYYQRDVKGKRGESIPTDEGYICYKQIKGTIDFCTVVASMPQD